MYSPDLLNEVTSALTSSNIQMETKQAQTRIAHLAVALDVRLVANVQSHLVAQFIPPPVVRIVAVAYGVEVESGPDEDRKMVFTTTVDERMFVTTNRKTECMNVDEE